MFISHLGSGDLESNVVRINDAKGKLLDPLSHKHMGWGGRFVHLAHPTHTVYSGSESTILISIVQVLSFWLVVLLHLLSVCALP